MATTSQYFVADSSDRIWDQVLDLIGNTEPMGGAETMDAAVVWEALQEKFNVFLLYPVKSLDDKKANIDQGSFPFCE